ncbi:MAG: hypothetical protein HOM25_03885 [Rhodospirillaceae bacterium]|jgi:hypothetical protein|nr:hypothetical protein [Rhodospirillaceae bacterium]
MRLNLGCGSNKQTGFVNVDMSPLCAPDVVLNLEDTPWPWPDSSVEEVALIHVLEHLGQTTEKYFDVLRELYRVCQHGAKITIVVPHPRHDDFLHDATHVRAVTVEGLSMFSRKNCEEWIASGHANTPLAMIVGVDFDVVDSEFRLEEPWSSELASGALSEKAVMQAIKSNNNVAKETKVILRVIKENN